MAGNTNMSDVPIQVVLLEYSPGQKRVFVRATWRDGHSDVLAPLRSEHQQNYVRLFEGLDNGFRGVGFTGLVAEPALVAEPPDESAPVDPADLYLSREGTLEARAKFVEMIKDENFYHERYSRSSLRQHWSGAEEGFHDEELQRRWKGFLAGWQAARGKKFY
jgi:hypothetical protein